jgi:beta-phosphoglucomutase-like phosphatase (HAD superfamily)
MMNLVVEGRMLEGRQPHQCQVIDSSEEKLAAAAAAVVVVVVVVRGHDI